MLVIRRRAGETIQIGEGIEITVTEITAARVKLAICAPRDVPVFRKETAATAQRNRTAARFAGEGGVSDVLRLIGAPAA